MIGLTSAVLGNILTDVNTCILGKLLIVFPSAWIINLGEKMAIFLIDRYYKLSSERKMISKLPTILMFL